MRTLLNPLFLIGCLFWPTVHVLRGAEKLPVFINSYLTDVFAIPVIGTLVLTFMRVFVTCDKYYVFPVTYVFFMVAYTGLIFEGILPLFSERYTADLFDILAYIMGGCLFHLFINKPFKKVMSSDDKPFY
ncbi:hypothetical protein H8S90_24410 [Olivibacter sp. SDN3]|uniref:hypothetical protein n=1 Tax=Olivibacter sp. SDN3 TaxID=2764720 RepID=UPI001650E985|nr:hypothetical protein [Olivibacter sp. SDN3]QNL49811.1 hypothetical protein H8S90_24410 [Olivibacter sp. SDN3]